jgi:hypothetical protein
VRQAYANFWLATTHDGIYTNTGAPLLPAVPFARTRHIGQELDLIGTYHIDRNIEAGLGYSRVFAGPYLNAVTAGRDFGYPFLNLEYRF